VYSHWVSVEPFRTAMTLIVQDEAVSVTPAGAAYNQYQYIGPILLYINDNEPLDIAATYFTNGQRLALSAVEIYRVLDPIPGTQPVLSAEPVFANQPVFGFQPTSATSDQSRAVPLIALPFIQILATVVALLLT
jgi:hypothetical protein